MTDFTPKVSEWLANFSAALDRLDFDAAVEAVCRRELLARPGFLYLEYQNRGRERTDQGDAGSDGPGREARLHGGSRVMPRWTMG